MIFKNGAEIREIYLGDVPVSEVYIGSRLVWGGREHLEGAAVIVLTSDALLKLADGVTYTAEGAGLFETEALGSVHGTSVMRSSDTVQPVVCAEPYMRRIAPMVASLNGSGAYRAAAGYTGADVYGTAENGGAVYLMQGLGANGNAAAAAKLGIGTHEGEGIPAAGGVMRIVPIASPIEELNAVSGAGEVLISADTGTAMQYTHAVGAAGVSKAGKNVLTALYDADGSLGEECEGNSAAISQVLASVQGSGAVSRLFDGTFREPLTAVSEAVSAYAGVELLYAGGIENFAVQRTSSVPGTGMGRNTRHTGMGLCSASMTTEIYTEPKPIQSDFDSTVITEMDVLNITDIDAMEIQI